MHPNKDKIYCFYCRQYQDEDVCSVCNMKLKENNQYVYYHFIASKRKETVQKKDKFIEIRKDIQNDLLLGKYIKDTNIMLNVQKKKAKT